MVVLQGRSDDNNYHPFFYGGVVEKKKAMATVAVAFFYGDVVEKKKATTSSENFNNPAPLYKQQQTKPHQRKEET